MASVIVFGPTGQIGSVAARTAAESGAKVWLAMRDTNKTIPGIDQNTKGTFERVQADLMDPDIVKKAVQTSGAKRAFFYLAHASKDHMRATVEALKAGGIDFAVFVSSFTVLVNQAFRDVPASEFLPYIHGNVEANLDDVFGEDNYAAVRPGAFASNLLEYSKGIAAGEVSLYSGTFEQDNISPSDIGRVSGSILVSGSKNGQKKVYVYGPQIRTIETSIREIGKILNKDIKIHYLTKEEILKKYADRGTPEHIAKYLIEVYGTAGPDKGAGERFPKYEEGVGNVERYTGRQSMSLNDWVRENEEALQ